MQVKPAGTHVPSLLLALASGLALLIAFLGAGGLFMYGLISLTQPNQSAGMAFTLFSLAWVALLVCLLVLPGFVLSIQRLRGRMPAFLHIRRPFLVASLCLMALPVALAAGEFLASRPDETGLLLLPPLQVLAVALPIWWLVELARRGLSAGSQQRTWGVVSVGVMITMPLVLVVELVAIVMIALLLFGWIFTRPDLMGDLTDLVRTLRASGADPETAFETLGPALQQPGVIYAVLTVIAGLMPLVEEILKPLALWFLAGKNLSLTQGFVYGAISGGIFALLESLGALNPGVGPGWAIVAGARIGTALLHITCSALVGLGLAFAWRQGKYLWLGGLLLAAFAIHATWNAASIFSGLEPLLDGGRSGFLGWLADASGFIILGLAILVLVVLLGTNRRLQKAAREEQLKAAQAVESENVPPERGIAPIPQPDATPAGAGEPPQA